MKKIIVLSCALSVILLSSGCTRRLSPNQYSVGAVGEAVQTYRGVIISVRPVEVTPDKLSDNTLGMGAGALAGGLLGSQIGGGGSAHIVGGVLGAAAGGVAGMFAQDALTSQNALEYVVQLDNGQLMTVVQGPEQVYSVGQRVLFMTSNQGRSRIVPDNSPAPAPGSAAARVTQQQIPQPQVTYYAKKVN